MSKASFEYVSYIQSTVEKVFAALTDPEATRDYWAHHRNRSDWKPGSRWAHEDYDDPSKVDVVGKVVEHKAPSLLVVTWVGPQDEGKAEQTSRVRIEVEKFMDIVRLTLKHDELEAGSYMHKGVTAGWPAVISSLKTFVETGKAMPVMGKRWEHPPQ